MISAQIMCFLSLNIIHNNKQCVFFTCSLCHFSFASACVFFFFGFVLDQKMFWLFMSLKQMKTMLLLFILLLHPQLQNTVYVNQCRSLVHRRLSFVHLAILIVHSNELFGFLLVCIVGTGMLLLLSRRRIGCDRFARYRDKHIQ